MIARATRPGVTTLVTPNILSNKNLEQEGKQQDMHVADEKMREACWCQRHDAPPQFPVLASS